MRGHRIPVLTIHWQPALERVRFRGTAFEGKVVVNSLIVENVFVGSRLAILKPMRGVTQR